MLRLPRARTSARPRSLACSTSLYVFPSLSRKHHDFEPTSCPLEIPTKNIGCHGGTEADISQGKAKYNKWQEVVNAGLSQQDAEAKYIELGEQLLKKHDS